MSDDLARAVAAVAADLTPREWADALWLAQFVPGGRPSSRPPDGSPSRPSTRSGPGPPMSERPPPPRSPEWPSVDEQDATLHLGAGTPSTARLTIGPFADVPAPAALPDGLRLQRSMRALRRDEPSRYATVLDEPATVAHVADSAVWQPLMRQTPTRRFELAMIVDTSPSMVLWRSTVAELHVLFERLGAFRDVRVWRFDADEPGIPLRHPGSDHRIVGSPRELVDPSGRRIIVVVSDCVGRAWRDGSAQRYLDLWARFGPVAVLHVLPQSLWRRCPPVFRTVRLGARRAGAPNAELERLSLDPGAENPPGWPVPVLQLDPRWLEPWSRLVGGTLPAIDAMALFTREPARPFQAEASARSLDPTRRVYRYRNLVSPEAFQLAAYLAAAPLSLPVMRLVQRALMPTSRPAHLAEFFLSDLIYAVDADPADPDSARYEFGDGIRELLLTRLRRSDILMILQQVADHIHTAYGGPRSFRAILASEEGSHGAMVTLPFARVLRKVLTSLGGSYARFASQLPSAGAITEPPSPNVVNSGVMGDIERETSLTETRQRRIVPGSHQGDHVTTPATPSDRTPAIFDGVPTRNPNFTGRVELLQALGERLSGSPTAVLPQALHGLGGVGKTQLAVEFCHRYASRYELVYWISAEQIGLARTRLAELGPRLGLPRSDDQGSGVAAVLEALRRGEPHRQWLLVFDNADRPEDIEPLLPDLQGPDGHILVTSRNALWTNVAKVVEVDVFTRQESLDLLERRGPAISYEDANVLAEKLGDLPLALEQAAAWRAETGMPVEEYLRLFDERLEQLLSEASPSNYPTSVAATWRIAFDRLLAEAPTALELLQLCAYFGAEPISLHLLPLGRFAPSMLADLRRSVADPIELGRAVRHLSRYALARIDPPSNTMQVHRLVQAVLRERLTAEESVGYQQAVQEILAAANPGDPDMQETWERHGKIAPHVLASGAVGGASEDVRRLILDQVRYHGVRGDFGSSRELGEVAYDRWRADPALGPDHEQTLLCGRLLGIALRWLGEPDRAREINEDTLRRQEVRFGVIHEHSLVTASSYGADLRAAGLFDPARELDERTYEGHRQVFGEDHVNTLQAANNLAVDRRFAGRFREAIELDLDTLERRRRVRGESHPETLLSYMNLGRDYYGIGSYTDARDMLERAINGYERAFSEYHPQLLVTYRIYSSALRKLGAYEAAHDQAVKNVARCRTRLGDRHLDTLASTINLCNTTRALKQSNQAAEIGRDLLALYQDVVGDEHPFTLSCAANYANTLRDIGDYREARNLDESIAPRMNAIYSKEHPSSLAVGNNLANDLYFAGEHPEALALSGTTMERSRVVRGVDDPYTLISCVNHAIDLRTAGREDEAQSLEHDTWRRFRKVLGERHPDTQLAMTGVRLDAEIDPPPT